MKRFIIAVALSIVYFAPLSGQARDTLTLYGCEFILNLEGFKEFKNSTVGYTMKHYYYVKKYEDPQIASASFIVAYCGEPLSSFIYPDIDYQVYSLYENNYGGQTVKCRSNDGLYFRQDAYKDFVHNRVSIMYHYVRKEDLDFFDRILDNVEIRPLK